MKMGLNLSSFFFIFLIPLTHSPSSAALSFAQISHFQLNLLFLKKNTRCASFENVFIDVSSLNAKNVSLSSVVVSKWNHLTTALHF